MKSYLILENISIIFHLKNTILGYCYCIKIEYFLGAAYLLFIV